jgi:hypothetical protein
VLGDVGGIKSSWAWPPPGWGGVEAPQPESAHREGRAMSRQAGRGKQSACSPHGLQGSLGGGLRAICHPRHRASGQGLIGVGQPELEED